jgi:hypothetical protein
MGHLYDLTENFVPLIFRRARPDQLRGFIGTALRHGGLHLRWRRARGADFYRIERTRSGRDYEWLGETEETCFFYREMVLHDRWFYRVTAVNSRGAGDFRMVCFHERRGNGKGYLVHVPARRGLRVTVGWLVRK